MKSFSARRSWATAKDFAPGKTSFTREEASSVAAGTFSNSQVTTSTEAAKRGESLLVRIASDRARSGNLEGRAPGSSE